MNLKNILILLLLLICINNILADQFVRVGAVRSYDIDTNFTIGDRLRYKGYHLLTPDAGHNVGALWDTNKVDFRDTVNINFIAEFGNDPNGADGIALVFHRDPRPLDSVIGSYGGGIGYGYVGTGSPYYYYDKKVENSFAIEFDTFFNGVLGPTNWFIEDIENDHTDIRFNGDMNDSNGIHFSLDSLKDGKNHEINMYWFPYDTAGVGRLKVYFQCNKVYDIENFNINDSIYKYTNETFANWTSEKCYYGLTAATGDEKNNHRVKFNNDLTLSSVDLCTNVQIIANFPSFCENVIYNWTPKAGLINPYTSNPIAIKSGYYTCSISFIDTTELVEDYLLLRNSPVVDSIYVDVESTEMTYRKTYGNRYKYNGVNYETNDLLCGSNMALDCGYLISGYNESFISPTVDRDYKSNSPLLLKTDYNGEIDWSRNYIYSGIYNIDSLTTFERENLRFHTIFHSVHPDFIAKYKTENEIGSSDDFSETLYKYGYILVGELFQPFFIDTNLNNNDLFALQKMKTLFTKLDLNGDIRESKYLRYFGMENSSTASNKIYPLDDYSYISNLWHNGRFGLIHIDYTEQNGFEIGKHFLFKKDIGTLYYYDNASVPINRSTSVMQDRAYNHFILISQVDENNQYDVTRLGILILNDFKTSTNSNIIKKYVSISDSSNHPNALNHNIVLNNNDYSKLYIVNPKQLTIMDLDGNVLNNYYYEFPSLGIIGNAIFKDSSIYIIAYQNNSNFPELFKIDLKNEEAFIINIDGTYDYSDNIMNVLDKIAYSSHYQEDINLNVVSDIHKVNCFDSTEVPLYKSMISSLVENKNDILVDDNYNFELVDAPLINLSHEIFEKENGCFSAQDSFCIGCENITPESFEFEMVKIQNESENCCYELYIKNKSLCDFYGFDFTLKYLSEDNPETYITDTIPQNKTLYRNERLKIKEFCSSETIFPNDFEVRLLHEQFYCQYYKADEDILIDLKWNFEFDCDTNNCCDNLEVLSIDYINNSPCKFELNFNLLNGCDSIFFIEIWDSENKKIYSSTTPLESRSNQKIQFSPNHNSYGEVENIRIVLYNGLNEILCVKDSLSLDFMQCICCNFDINPSYNQIDSSLIIYGNDILNQGIECGVADIEIKYLCNLNQINPFHHFSGILNNFYDDYWRIETPCVYDGDTCNNPYLRVIIYYEDSSYCTKFFEIDCVEGVVGPKVIFEEIFAKEYELKIYPNPTNSISYLEFNLKDDSNLELNLLDNNGSKVELIFSGLALIGGNKFAISTSNLSSGAYYVEIIVNGIKLRYKLLVEK